MVRKLSSTLSFATMTYGWAGSGAPDGSVTKQSSSARRTPLVLSTLTVVPLARSITLMVLVPVLPLAGASVAQTKLTGFPLPKTGTQPTVQLGLGFLRVPVMRITPLGPEPVTTDEG